MRALPLLFLFLVAALLLAAPAAAEDDAAELLRLGRVAETVERDLDKALGLYERAIQLDPDGIAGAEAQWAIARLQESRGRTSKALGALRALTSRFGGVMTEARKREVHDALLRLLPPGSQEPSPLGTIYVATSGADLKPETSPLARKIRELVGQYVETSDARRTSAYRKLLAVGKDVLPILLAIAREDSSSHATAAADLAAQLGKADALDGLVRLASEGDPITRQAAVKAFEAFRPGIGLPSDRIVAGIDTLLALELSDSERYTLREVLDDHVTPAARLERHLAGGAWAAWWLDRALESEAPGAVDRALELIRGGGQRGREALVDLVPLVTPQGKGASTYPADTLPAEDAVRALDLLLSEPWTGAGSSVYTLHLLLGLIEQQAGTAEGAKARERTWRTVASIENGRARQAVGEYLGSQGSIPSASLLSDRAVARTLFEIVANPEGSEYTRRKTLQRLVALGPPFWEAFFDVVPQLDVAFSRDLLVQLKSSLPHVSGQPTRAPDGYERRWVDLLEQVDLATDKFPVPRFVVQAAARSGDPRFLDLVRRHTLDRRWEYPHLYWIDDLREYDGPGRHAFVEDMLKAEGFPEQRAYALLQTLVGDPSLEARQLLVKIASDWAHPLGQGALNFLDDIGARDETVEITRRVQHAEEDVPFKYRTTLIGLVKGMHLREAIPYLLHEFRKGQGAPGLQAPQAMDAIRDYYRRLETFERFAEGEDASPPQAPRRKVEDLLDDEDATIRRAAVIALGALGRKDALDRLVFLAKEDPDERVRKAALEAVEKIAANR